jgi:hypothetical protein
MGNSFRLIGRRMRQLMVLRPLLLIERNPRGVKKGGSFLHARPAPGKSIRGHCGKKQNRLAGFLSYTLPDEYRECASAQGCHNRLRTASRD